jgi:hypothetical protein
MYPRMIHWYRIFVFGMVGLLLGVLYHADRSYHQRSDAIQSAFARGDSISEENENLGSPEGNGQREQWVKEIEANPTAERFLELFATASVVDAMEVVEGDGVVIRREVLATEMKHPLIRREITYRRDPTSGSWVPVAASAYVADQVIVGLKRADAIEQLKPLLDKLDLQLVGALGEGENLVIQLKATDTDSVERMIRTLALLEEVDFAEPNYLRLAANAPNDPSFGDQWAMRNTGQRGGSAGADLRVLPAWDLAPRKGAEVVVAVVDTGIDIQHPDIRDNVFQNPNERSDGLDSDRNGYIDDLHGWNFAAAGRGSPDVSDKSSSGHGTHVAGIIGAVANNMMGISGVAPNVRLLPIKVMDGDFTYMSDFVLGLDYAVRMGAHIVNVSLGSKETSRSEAQAINRLQNAGILVVVAAGNEGSDEDLHPTYPGSYDNGNVLSVAAHNRRDGLSSFSNYGRNRVDVAAPGNEILSTVPGGGYQYMSGTSMAAPHAAGVAALVKSAVPSFSSERIRELLIQTARTAPAFEGRLVASGRIDAYEAVRVAIESGFVPSGSQVMLRSDTNQGYVVPLDEAAARLQAVPQAEGVGTIWEVVRTAPGLYSFRSLKNGLFATVSWAGNAELGAVSGSPGAAESFRPQALGGDRFAFLSEPLGKYVSAEDQARAPLVANRQAIGGWESFTVIPVRPLQPGTRVALQASVNQNYVAPDSQGILVAQDPTAGVRHIFEVGLTEDGYITLKSIANGKYVSAEQAGTLPLVANRDAIGDWERFVAVYQPNGLILIRSKVNGKWVTAENHGQDALIANRDFAGGWEEFVVHPIR